MAHEVARARPLQQLIVSTSVDGVLPRVTGAAFTASGGLALAVNIAGAASSEILLYNNDVLGAPFPQPCKRVSVPANITCFTRLRSGGAGDYAGPGTLLAVGRADGVLMLLDAHDLNELVAWITPSGAAVYSVDLSPCTGYIVAGCGKSVVTAFALPALPVAVPVELDSERDESLLASLAAGAVSVGGAAIAHVESAKTVARSAKAMAGEASSVVKGLFGSIFGKNKQ